MMTTSGRLNGAGEGHGDGCGNFLGSGYGFGPGHGNSLYNEKGGVCYGAGLGEMSGHVLTGNPKAPSYGHGGGGYVGQGNGISTLIG